MSLDLNQIIWPEPGNYVLAVSGGVDSMTLLDLFAENSEYDVTVAHFNHGWSDSADAFEALVKEAAARHSLPFFSQKKVVPRSEAAAREARYGFLFDILDNVEAQAIVTAHHHDDLIETMTLHSQRGTGRKGLTPFSEVIERPLINLPKSQLIEYAIDRGIEWAEDSSNQDLRLKRNQVRHQLHPSQKAQLAQIHKEAKPLNQQIDRELAELFLILDDQATANRSEMRALDIDVLTELIVAMIRAAQPDAEVHRRSIEALAVDLKTGRLKGPRALSNSLSVVPSRDTVTIVFNA